MGKLFRDKSAITFGTGNLTHEMGEGGTGQLPLSLQVATAGKGLQFAFVTVEAIELGEGGKEPDEEVALVGLSHDVCPDL